MHDGIIDIDDHRRQHRVWNSYRDRFADRTMAVEHPGLAAADQHRVILAERNVAAARRNGNVTRPIHKEVEIVVAVCDHLTRS
jgi:hypothetical protein